MPTTEENLRLKAGLAYAARDWPVIALHTPTRDGCSCGKKDCGSVGKHPRWNKEDLPNGVKSATTDPAIIRTWWTRWRNANIGIATGQRSFDVLDVDVNEREDGNESLAGLEKKHGRLPDTIEQITGAGRQIFFKYSGKIKNSVRFAAGLDTRSEGGYVVVYPSLHVSGRKYEWELSSHPDDVSLASCPAWLIEAINGRPQAKGSADKIDPVQILAGVPEGQRDNSLFQYACRLRAKNMTKEEVKVLVLQAAANCSPPLPPQEALRKIESAWTYKKSETQPSNLEFPDIMSGLAGDFAELYAAYLEPPPHFFYMSFLTSLGNTVANELTILSEIVPQPRLYVILLGESADDRKSTVLAKTNDFFKEAVDKHNICWGVGSAEGLQKRLEESNRLLLCFDEFKQFISKCKIEASVLLPCVNTLFESNRYESRTKKTDICLRDAYLSLIAASTISTYENTWSSQFTDIGFNNRLFLVPGSGDRKFSVPAKIPDREKYILKQRLGEILRHVGGARELEMSPAARKVYHTWYLNLERSVHTKRLDTYALRLMPLLAVNELEHGVNTAIVNKAIALCDWQLEVRRLYDPVDADNKVARMEEKIRRVLGRGTMSDRDLKRLSNAHRAGLWIYTTAINNLKRAREIRWHKEMKAWEQL